MKLIQTNISVEMFLCLLTGFYLIYPLVIGNLTQEEYGGLKAILSFDLIFIVLHTLIRVIVGLAKSKGLSFLISIVSIIKLTGWLLVSMYETYQIFISLSKELGEINIWFSLILYLIIRILEYIRYKTKIYKSMKSWFFTRLSAFLFALFVLLCTLLFFERVILDEKLLFDPYLPLSSGMVSVYYLAFYYYLTFIILAYTSRYFNKE